MLTNTQARTIRAVVNVFESGSPRGNYGCVTCVEGDAGHLTYGCSQASLASGNLYRLIKEYCDAPGALCAQDLSAFLDRLQARDTSLDHDQAMRSALERAGADPVMLDTQDALFTKAFFEPARKAAENGNIFTALGTAVVYDSFIQGGWQIVRKLVVARSGHVSGAVSEQRWIGDYVQTRRGWLESAGGLLAKSVYRMDAFRQLIDDGEWEMELPLRVRGIAIDEAALDDSGPRRILRLRTPPMNGEDVRQLQFALAARGSAAPQDGVFGADTETALRNFQAAHGLNPDGVAGPQTWAAVLKAKAAGL
jgi:chitosanase